MCPGSANNHESIQRNVAEAEAATDRFSGLFKTYAICEATQASLMILFSD